MVTPLLEGRDLFNVITEDAEDGMEERRAVNIAREVLAAVKGVHAVGVAHGDIKPENIMISLNDKVTLVDFAYSAGPHRGGRCTLGTMTYMAPEQLRGAHASFPVDMFAVGATFFTMLTGELAFEDRLKQNMGNTTARMELPFSKSNWGSASIDARLLITALLHPTPEVRPSAAMALNASWIRPAMKLQVDACVGTNATGDAEVWGARARRWCEFVFFRMFRRKVRYLR